MLEVTESRVGEEGDSTDSEDNTPFKKADGRLQKEVASVFLMRSAWIITGWLNDFDLKTAEPWRKSHLLTSLYHI